MNHSYFKSPTPADSSMNSSGSAKGRSASGSSSISSSGSSTAGAAARFIAASARSAMVSAAVKLGSLTTEAAGESGVEAVASAVDPPGVSPERFELSGSMVTRAISSSWTGYSGTMPSHHNTYRSNKSYTNTITVSPRIRMITTAEARINCCCVGQLTLLISASTAIKKSANGA